MTPEAFCYWLQGFFELSRSKDISAKQTKEIKNHLNLVFEHSIDPQATAGLPAEQAKKVQEKLQAIHDGKSPFDGTHFSGGIDGTKLYRC